MKNQSAAYQQGVDAYWSDEYKTNPYPTGSDEFRDFQSGWWDTYYAMDDLCTYK